MLRDEKHLRAAQREAEDYPREVALSGTVWQFWSLASDSHRKSPVAWYTNGAQFLLISPQGETRGVALPARHDCPHWPRHRPKNNGMHSRASLEYVFLVGHESFRMADERTPDTRTPSRQHPLFPEQPDNLRLPAAVKARLLAEWLGVKSGDTVQ